MKPQGNPIMTSSRNPSRAVASSGLTRLLQLIEGPQTLGRGKGFWSVFALVLLIAVIWPLFSDGWTVGNVAYFLVGCFMALGLGVIWGYAGALSFGQTAFFGLAGYAYGVLTINFGSAYGFTLIALLLAVGLAGLFALVLGYFMFYGRISGVFIGIVTLAVTLSLQAFMAQTAGPQWAIGTARLNGFNGMSGMPPLTIPWFGDAILLYADTALYYVLLGLLVVIYFALRILLNSRFGNVLVAIRENPERAQMLGYDIRLYQMVGFAIGGMLAGLSGVLYTAWGQYITPSSMGMTAAALPVIWVAFGGAKDITATLIGTLIVLSAYQALTIHASQYAIVVMGTLLVVTVLFAPQGIVFGLMKRVFGRTNGGEALK